MYSHSIGRSSLRVGLVSSIILARQMAISGSSRPINSYFELFPKNFPAGGPPKDSFISNSKSMRREYRQLQSENHPDILFGSSILKGVKDQLDFSSVINRAYTALRNPYSRISHFIQLYHPQHLDITQDEVAKELIANFQSHSNESSFEYKDMLMVVLEAHESLEMATLETELDDLTEENDARIRDSEEKLEKLIRNDWPIKDWDPTIMEAIRLKYWVNIQNGIKEWEQGKPVHLTH